MTSRHKSVEPEIVIFIVPIATLLLQRLLHSNPRPRPQPFSHVAVLDLEATCLRGERIRPQEVIEVACLLLRCPAVGDGDGEGGAGSSEVSLFYRLVRPVKRPRLSPFCTSLTGVTQAMVDGAEEFPKVCWVCVLLQLCSSEVLEAVPVAFIAVIFAAASVAVIFDAALVVVAAASVAVIFAAALVVVAAASVAVIFAAALAVVAVAAAVIIVVVGLL